MGKCGGITLIVIGVMILFNVIIMAIGGLKVVIGGGLPIGLHFAPLNQNLKAWVDVPLSMAMEAQLFSASTFDAEGYLGAGLIEFQVTLSSGGPEDEGIEAVAAVYIQEDAEIDEIQRYVLNAGPLNYPSILFLLIALVALAGMVVAIFRRVKMKGTGKEDKVAAAPPPEAVVSVIPLDDDEK